MKKVLRMLGLLLAGVVFLGACAATFVQVRGIPSYDKPQVAAQKIVATPARIAHGQKIVNAMCADCHLNKQTGALTGKLLTELPPEFGKLYSANITQDKQHGIGAWSDEELVGLLRTGIGRDGRFRVVMPNFVHMSDEDVASVISYLHSTDSQVQPNATPSHEQEPSFLAKALVNTVMKPLPMPAGAVLAPEPTDAVAYGRYLVIGRYKCYDCHSKDFKTNNHLEPEQSEGYLAGGAAMTMPDGSSIVTRNLTPDPETGLGDWTEAQFVQAVRYGQSPHGPLRAPMPKFTLMDETEAKAIYAYLRTVPVLKNATPEDGAAAVATR
ncbi:c-type cytochrome [Hymenobacter jeollabukensis]|uniref:Cytochrome c n=1 Tax=Hymenobacter jeollabukensis TaxID=2025313 RepID=A0A5R8WWU0_9BACT|nr:cytochrome c [Hymenobacter jeollabukensis]TLM96692.1 cytochrome c [Hymenobacter jeollabukensis]